MHYAIASQYYAPIAGFLELNGQFNPLYRIPVYALHSRLAVYLNTECRVRAPSINTMNRCLRALGYTLRWERVQKGQLGAGRLEQRVCGVRLPGLGF